MWKIIGYLVLLFLVGTLGWVAGSLPDFEETEAIPSPACVDYFPYPEITTNEVFEREMIEKLVEVLQDSKGSFIYEKNAAGFETIKINISWGK